MKLVQMEYQSNNPALHIEDRLVVSNTNAEIGVEGDDTHVPGGNGYIEFTDGTRMYTKPKNTIIASNSVSPYQPFNAATTLDTKSLPNNGDAIFIQFIAPDTGVYNKVQLRLSNVDSNNELKSTGKIGVAIYDNLTTSINATPNVPDNRKGYGILTISDLQTAELRGDLIKIQFQEPAELEAGTEYWIGIASQDDVKFTIHNDHHQPSGLVLRSGTSHPFGNGEWADGIGRSGPHSGSTSMQTSDDMFWFWLGGDVLEPTGSGEAGEDGHDANSCIWKYGGHGNNVTISEGEVWVVGDTGLLWQAPGQGDGTEIQLMFHHSGYKSSSSHVSMKHWLQMFNVGDVVMRSRENFAVATYWEVSLGPITQTNNVTEVIKLLGRSNHSRCSDGKSYCEHRRRNND